MNLKIKTVSRINRTDKTFDVEANNNSFLCPICGSEIDYEDSDSIIVTPIPNVSCTCGTEFAFID